MIQDYPSNSQHRNYSGPCFLIDVCLVQAGCCQGCREGGSVAKGAGEGWLEPWEPPCAHVLTMIWPKHLNGWLQSGTWISEKIEVCWLASLLMILHHSAHLRGLSGRWGRGWECGKQLWGEEREAEGDAGCVCSSVEPKLKKNTVNC